MPAKIASAIVQANENLEPATLRAATAQFTLGINRRLIRPHHQVQTAANRSGPADAEVGALGAYRPNGTPIAFLMNYPCHGVVLCEDNLLYSRDWPGFAMDEIESAAVPPPARAQFRFSFRARPATSILAAAAISMSPNNTAARWAVPPSTRSNRRPRLPTQRIATRRIPLRLKLKDISAELALARDCAAQTQASLDNHRGGDGYQLKRLRDHHAQSLSALGRSGSPRGAKSPRPPR